MKKETAVCECVCVWCERELNEPYAQDDTLAWFNLTVSIRWSWGGENVELEVWTIIVVDACTFAANGRIANTSVL